MSIMTQPTVKKVVLSVEERMAKLELALASLGSATLAGGKQVEHHFLEWLKDHVEKL